MTNQHPEISLLPRDRRRALDGQRRPPVRSEPPRDDDVPMQALQFLEWADLIGQR